MQDGGQIHEASREALLRVELRRARRLVMRDADEHEMEKGDRVLLLQPITYYTAFLDVGAVCIFQGEYEHAGKIYAHLICGDGDRGFLADNTAVLLEKSDISLSGPKPRCPRRQCLAPLVIFQGDWYCNRCKQPLWLVRQGLQKQKR